MSWASANRQHCPPVHGHNTQRQSVGILVAPLMSAQINACVMVSHTIHWYPDAVKPRGYRLKASRINGLGSVYNEKK